MPWGSACTAARTWQPRFCSGWHATWFGVVGEEADVLPVDGQVAMLAGEELGKLSAPVVGQLVHVFPQPATGSPEMSAYPALVKRALGRDWRMVGGKAWQPKSEPPVRLTCWRIRGMIQRITGTASVRGSTVSGICHVVKALPLILPSERPRLPEFRERRQSGISARRTSNRDGASYQYGLPGHS